MKRRVKSAKAAVCAVLLGSAFVLNGCGGMPDMTEDEAAMISEYAAGLLLKYDEHYVSRVVDTTEYHKEEERKAREAEEAERKAREEAEKQAALEAEQAAQESSSGQSSAQMVSSIEEFYQIPGVRIQYSGYGIYDSYPDSAEGEDLFFSLSASAGGNKLLILFFDVANVSGGEMEFSMLDISPKFRISINGGTSQGTLFTFLPEELAMYHGNLGADETVRTVIAAEIPAEEAGAINSMTLILRGGSGSAQLQLQ